MSKKICKEKFNKRLMLINLSHSGFMLLISQKLFPCNILFITIYKNPKNRDHISFFGVKLSVFDDFFLPPITIQFRWDNILFFCMKICIKVNHFLSVFQCVTQKHKNYTQSVLYRKTINENGKLYVEMQRLIF